MVQKKLTDQERYARAVKLVLENPLFPEGLETDVEYTRFHDDDDGTQTGSINVIIGRDGDAWLRVTKTHNEQAMRFRTFFGGGQSERVKNALVLLALAIKQDNEHPLT